MHTEVEDAALRKGSATELIQGTLDDIRVRGIEIVPVCEFVEHFIDKHPEYDDLVDHEMFDALNAENTQAEEGRE